eukprot:5237448-Amphidinium_carterae.2
MEGDGDDVYLLLHHPRHLQHMLNDLALNLAHVGLQLNPAKLQCITTASSPPEYMHLDGVLVPPVAPTEGFTVRGTCLTLTESATGIRLHGASFMPSLGISMHAASGRRPVCKPFIALFFLAVSWGYSPAQLFELAGLLLVAGHSTAVHRWTRAPNET